MSYNIRVDLSVRDHGALEWREPTEDEYEVLENISDGASYVLGAGEGTWYSIDVDLALWSTSVNLEVKAEVRAEDGLLWRVYARGGEAKRVRPEITWTEPTSWFGEYTSRGGDVSAAELLLYRTQNNCSLAEAVKALGWKGTTITKEEG